ncbi:ABC transporter permease, partial [bacterium]
MSVKIIGNYLRLEKKLQPSPLAPVLIPVISVLLALVLGGAFLTFTGHSPMAVYQEMFTGAFGTVYGLSETVVKAIPLILAGLGVSLAFRMQLWNIGAEGQIY